MTPKEKAKELVSKFTFLSYPESNEKFYNPKQCALIAVDEIIKEINITSYLIKFQIDYGIYLYWEEVKQEIEIYGGKWTKTTLIHLTTKTVR